MESKQMLQDSERVFQNLKFRLNQDSEATRVAFDPKLWLVHEKHSEILNDLRCKL